MSRVQGKPARKGFRITDGQYYTFWRLWKAGCEGQGWTAAAGWSKEMTEAKRHELLERCGFASLTEVDKREGFDRVKNALLLLQDNVAAGAESVQDGQARRIRAVIEGQLLPCLALYVEEPQAYFLEIIRDKTRWLHDGQGPVRDIRLEDLSNRPVVRVVNGEPQESDSELEQALSTLSRAVDVFRRKAGHSGHDMRTAAGLPCACAACRNQSGVVVEGAAADPW
jgi:hypothetical protein